MRSVILSVALLPVWLAILAVTQAYTDNFIITQAPAIAVARMDPIVSSGSVGGHVHNVVGASNFNSKLNTPAVQHQAQCTTTIVVNDLSNYWAPYLYYRYPNNTYQPIISNSRIYYFTKGGNVTAFPQGLRMISGSATTRNASDTKTFGVYLTCDGKLQTQYLPTYATIPDCGEINMGIYFPSCGLSSGDLDSEDHFSHMAWPQSYDGSQLVDDPNGSYCPESHPIKYPTIFFETNYVLQGEQVWRDDENVLVLAQGDTTGLTYHADFVMGWKEGVLESVIAQCGNGNDGPGDALEWCPPLNGTTDYNAAFACRLEGQIPDEDVGFYHPLDALPGCNPLWTADMQNTKPSCTPTTGDPSFVGPNTFFGNLLLLMHIPMAFELAVNTTADFLASFITTVGTPGASWIGAWGNSGGSDDSHVTVGTYDQIIAGLARNNSANSTASSNATSSATPSSSVSQTAIFIASTSAAASFISSVTSTVSLPLAVLSTGDGGAIVAVATPRSSSSASSVSTSSKSHKAAATSDKASSTPHKASSTSGKQSSVVATHAASKSSTKSSTSDNNDGKLASHDNSNNHGKTGQTCHRPGSRAERDDLAPGIKAHKAKRGKRARHSA